MSTFNLAPCVVLSATYVLSIATSLWAVTSVTELVALNNVGQCNSTQEDFVQCQQDVWLSAGVCLTTDPVTTGYYGGNDLLRIFVVGPVTYQAIAVVKFVLGICGAMLIVSMTCLNQTWMRPCGKETRLPFISTNVSRASNILLVAVLIGASNWFAEVVFNAVMVESECGSFDVRDSPNLISEVPPLNMFVRAILGPMVLIVILAQACGGMGFRNLDDRNPDGSAGVA